MTKIVDLFSTHNIASLLIAWKAKYPRAFRKKLAGSWPLSYHPRQGQTESSDNISDRKEKKDVDTKK
jgi:hypothetical protein